MIVLALLLLLAAAALIVFVVVTGNEGRVPLDWQQLSLEFSPSPLVLFLLGALTLLLVVLALGLLRSGSKRQSEKRRELKRLRRLDEERGTGPADRPMDKTSPVASPAPQSQQQPPSSGSSADPR